MSVRYGAPSIRCPKCDSGETLRTSKVFGNQSRLCLDCDHAWTTRAEVVRKTGETKAPRVAASARDMEAALRKIPPPSADQIRLMLANARKTQKRQRR